MSKNKKFYITTSIFYTNAPPHIGSALELVQADVLARYRRLLGKEVFFLTGTDEHGAKVAKAAKKEKKEPKNFVDDISEKFKALKKVLNLSNDDFIRTTDKKRHWPTVKMVWSKLKENGDIYKKKYKGFYCIGCEAFITKKDLINGKCAIHEKTPEIIKEENYFFRLSKYSKKIEKTIRNNEIKIIPESRKKETLNFIEQGLEDVSFSRPRRDLKWGIPMPDDKAHTLYVWYEALLNYISALSYSKNSDKFKKYWPADIHCLGKDIMRFHTIFWPAMLFSLGLKLPKIIFVHGFITSDGQKMSKSLGSVINPFELVEKYGVDTVRYFLLREIPPTEDGDFTYEKFEKRYNSDLAKGLGNLVARTLTLAKKSKIKYQKSKIEIKIKKFIDKTWRNYHKNLNNFKFNEVLISTWGLISFCDQYIERQKPWELLKKIENRKQKIEFETIINNLLFALDNIAQILRPFLPKTAEEIFRQLKTKKSKALFPRI